MELDQSIKNPGSSSTFGDVSQIELAPIPYGYPKILEYDQRNGKIHAVSFCKIVDKMIESPDFKNLTEKL